MQYSHMKPSLRLTINEHKNVRQRDTSPQDTIGQQTKQAANSQCVIHEGQTQCNLKDETRNMRTTNKNRVCNSHLKADSTYPCPRHDGNIHCPSITSLSYMGITIHLASPIISHLLSATLHSQRTKIANIPTNGERLILRIPLPPSLLVEISTKES